VNVLKKESQSANKVAPSACRLGGSFTTPHHKNVTKCLHRVLDVDGFFGMTKEQKIDMRFGTWNVRSPSVSGSLKWILEKSCARVWTGIICLRIGIGGGLV
jgi:hypothetical protein